MRLRIPKSRKAAYRIVAFAIVSSRGQPLRRRNTFTRTNCDPSISAPWKFYFRPFVHADSHTVRCTIAAVVQRTVNSKRRENEPWAALYLDWFAPRDLAFGSLLGPMPSPRHVLSAARQKLVLFELTPANKFSLLGSYERTLGSYCVDPLRPSGLLECGHRPVSGRKPGSDDASGSGCPRK